MKKSSTEKIHYLQQQLNKTENVPNRCYRRNVSIYELVCYVNNITGCYISENFDPIPVFIERSKQFMEVNSNNEWEMYYHLANEYFEAIENSLGLKRS